MFVLWVEIESSTFTIQSYSLWMFRYLFRDKYNQNLNTQSPIRYSFLIEVNIFQNLWSRIAVEQFKVFGKRQDRWIKWMLETTGMIWKAVHWTSWLQWPFNDKQLQTFIKQQLHNISKSIV